MKSRDVRINGTYLAKVSGKVVPVRILELCERWRADGSYYSFWRARNTATGREIRIKSPRRLRVDARNPTAEVFGYA